jgi:hypothetical protein
MTVHLTAHAIARMQQRGIRSETLEALLDHGRAVRGPGGSEIVILRKKYAVIGSDGVVITVGHRTKRLPRS